jgi:hypothetical protein
VVIAASIDPVRRKEKRKKKTKRKKKKKNPQTNYPSGV